MSGSTKSLAMAALWTLILVALALLVLGACVAEAAKLEVVEMLTLLRITRA